MEKNASTVEDFSINAGEVEVDSIHSTLPPHYACLKMAQGRQRKSKYTQQTVKIKLFVLSIIPSSSLIIRMLNRDIPLPLL